MPAQLVPKFRRDACQTFLLPPGPNLFWARNKKAQADVLYQDAPFLMSPPTMAKEDDRRNDRRDAFRASIASTASASSTSSTATTDSTDSTAPVPELSPSYNVPTTAPSSISSSMSPSSPSPLSFFPMLPTPTPPTLISMPSFATRHASWITDAQQQQPWAAGGMLSSEHEDLMMTDDDGHGHDEVDPKAAVALPTATTDAAPAAFTPKAFHAARDSSPRRSRHLKRVLPSILRCRRCAADIAFSSQIISKGFTGRHGRAFLVSAPATNADHLFTPEMVLDGSGNGFSAFDARNASYSRSVLTEAFKDRRILNNLMNISVGTVEHRQLVTGPHVVADIMCRVCGARMGWKYIDAREPAQHYKIGKFILEVTKIATFHSWEDDEEHAQCDDTDQFTFSGDALAAGDCGDISGSDGVDGAGRRQARNFVDPDAYAREFWKQRRLPMGSGTDIAVADPIAAARSLMACQWSTAHQKQLRQKRKRERAAAAGEDAADDEGRSSSESSGYGSDFAAAGPVAAGALPLPPGPVRGKYRLNRWGVFRKTNRWTFHNHTPLPVEFDSEDEDECDEIFAGTWDAAAVAKRRVEKRAALISAGGERGRSVDF